MVWIRGLTLALVLGFDEFRVGAHDSAIVRAHGLFTHFLTPLLIRVQFKYYII